MSVQLESGLSPVSRLARPFARFMTWLRLLRRSGNVNRGYASFSAVYCHVLELTKCRITSRILVIFAFVLLTVRGWHFWRLHWLPKQTRVKKPKISLPEHQKLLLKTCRYVNPPSRNLFSINLSYFRKLLTFRCQPNLNWLHDWRKQQEIGCIKCGSPRWKMWSAYFGQGNHLIFNLHHDSKVKPKCLQFRRVFCIFCIIANFTHASPPLPAQRLLRRKNYFFWLPFDAESNFIFRSLMNACWWWPNLACCEISLNCCLRVFIAINLQSGVLLRRRNDKSSFLQCFCWLAKSETQEVDIETRFLITQVLLFYLSQTLSRIFTF